MIVKVIDRPSRIAPAHIICANQAEGEEDGVGKKRATGKTKAALEMRIFWEAAFKSAQFK
jgi:hypothetical protein